MQKNPALIQTKMHLPGIRSQMVLRTRLQERMSEIGNHKLTLITAPAGYGKTTLIVSSISYLNMPIAWLSLEKQDNQETRFLTYLLTSLQTIDEAIGKDAAKFLEGSQQFSIEPILTSLINDLASIQNNICFVLDDYQFISNAEIHQAILFLLEHAPDSFHLVICTRSDPPLPLAQLRSRNQMIELRAEDLSFTTPEAAAFLGNILDVKLETNQIELLSKRTEGWIAGLQMAALSMRGREDVASFINAFAGTNRFIMDFMMEEVLSRESDEVQEFLYQTSILHRMNGGICNAVIGIENGQEMLAYLEKRNLFVFSLDDERNWYRYHQLFADLLKARLLQSRPQLANQLYGRASDWCENQNLINEAVEYGLLSHDYEKVTVQIDKYWPKISLNGELQTVNAWLDAIPRDVVENNVILSITRCWVYWLSGQVSRIESDLEHAEKAWERLLSSADFRKNDVLYAQVPASLKTLHSFLARYRNDYENAIALAEQALALLPENIPDEENNQLKSMILLSLASSYDGAGLLEEAVNTYTEFIQLNRKIGNVGGVTGITYRLVGVLRLLGKLNTAYSVCKDSLAYVQSKGLHDTPAMGILLVAFAEILIERNELEAAQSYLDQAVDLGKWGGRLDAIRNAAPALARLYLIHGDIQSALQTVESIAASLGSYPSPLALAELLSVKTRILIRQNDLHGAAVCIEEAKTLVGNDHGQTGVMMELSEIRLLIAQNEFSLAVKQLQNAIAIADSQQRYGVLVELHILQSMAHWINGDLDLALRELQNTLLLGEKQGYVRIFLDEEQPMEMLLNRWVHENREHSCLEFALNLRSQIAVENEKKAAANDQSYQPDTKTKANQSLIEPLSERELEVLELMAIGMTNKEIANKLVVASGTIKAHAASIYRKLNVANRTEAVSYARDIHLIS